ncbi:hypothetical protein GA0070624_4185 [Micromonospora rhizosphaerae]|uniref:Uncharacterized protein n=1 Tax=Micromonospora rhizosphaerae TaxID=568872 RepID=A0A1C6SNF1_9ACTN|nr:hypothetical protein [Micromonospora rhizosphaerae]SCL31010.1 hypothetical protein GA0070624_4185 [Micromonospora rhizosphaerae]
MTSQQTDGPAPTRPPHRLIGLLLAASTVVGLVLTVGSVIAGRETAPAQAASAANTEAGPARCPESWNDEPTPTQRGKDVLVPTGATEALLCSYRQDASSPLDLDVSRRITSKVDELTAYLNGLPSSPPEETVCLLGQPTEHAFVFGYPGQRSAVIRLSNCAWQRDDAIRYGGDLRKVTAYWGVRWNQ